MNPRVSFTVFGEKSPAACANQASISSPTVALVRTDRPRAASFTTFVEGPLSLPLAATDRASRRALLAGHRVRAEVDPQFPGVASLAHERFMASSRYYYSPR